MSSLHYRREIDQIRRLKYELLKEIPAETPQAIERAHDILQQLQTTTMAVEILEETLIGKVLCKFKKHAQLGPLAREIIQQWKALLTTGSTNDETPASISQPQAKQALTKQALPPAKKQPLFTDCESVINEQESETFYFFYRTASPFSQWHLSPYILDGVHYTCAEQGMMHGKALLFGDQEIGNQILQAGTNQRKIKALGRKVRGFDGRSWGRHRWDIVYRNSLAKFTQNAHLRHALLVDTAGASLLVEASPTDKIWGIGMSETVARKTHSSKWKGSNLLGKILTRVRDEISSGQHDALITKQAETGAAAAANQKPPPQQPLQVVAKATPKANAKNGPSAKRNLPTTAAPQIQNQQQQRGGRVCNVKVENIRRQNYHTLQDWIADPSNLYIGRRGVVFVETTTGGKQRFPPVDSPWCNPFRISKTATREDVIQQYENHLRERLAQNPSLKQDLVTQLDGKNLGCWCHPEACHGDVLLKILKEIKSLS